MTTPENKYTPGGADSRADAHAEAGANPRGGTNPRVGADSPVGTNPQIGGHSLTDTHSHLYDPAFDGDRAEALRRAADAGVERILLPAIDSQSHAALFALSVEHPDRCFPMMGLHPTSVNDNPDYGRELSLVEKYLAAPPEGIDKFYAVGEIGLDLYWSKEWIDAQREVFTRQIELALHYDLPVVIHTRNAWSEMEEVLSGFAGRELRGVMHAFSGGHGEYLRLTQYGDFLFGIGGVATYKNSGVAELLERIPIGEIVLETDCPYLSPVPFRGKRNESAYLTYICNRVAEIKGLLPDEVARRTTENAIRMFGL